MTLASVLATIASNGLGTRRPSTPPPAFVGCCSSGWSTPSLVSTPRSSSPTTATALGGPSPSSSLGGGPVICRARRGPPGALTGLTLGDTARAVALGRHARMTLGVTGTPRDACDVKGEGHPRRHDPRRR